MDNIRYVGVFLPFYRGDTAFLTSCLLPDRMRSTCNGKKLVLEEFKSWPPLRKDQNKNGFLSQKVYLLFLNSVHYGQSHVAWPVMHSRCIKNFLH